MKNFDIFSVATLLLITLIPSIESSCFGSLYATDPLNSGVTVDSGNGHVVVTNYVGFNGGNDLSWSLGELSLAGEGMRMSTYMDLGVVPQIAATYGISQFASVYVSIHLVGNELVIIHNFTDSETTFQSLNKSGTFPPRNESVSFVPVIGHIYIVNITDGTDTSFVRLFKLMIIDVTPSNSVITIRWDVLFDSQSGTQSSCFIQSNVTSMITNQGSMMFTNNTIEDTTNKIFGAPTWVGATIGVLFVLSIISIIILIVIIVKMRHHGYRQI